jgi:hypothetical protein
MLFGVSVVDRIKENSGVEGDARPHPRVNQTKLQLASAQETALESTLTHSDRLRDWPFDAGATSEANPFEMVPSPAKTQVATGFREMRDQAAILMGLVVLSLLCGISG